MSDDRFAKPRLGLGQSLPSQQQPCRRTGVFYLRPIASHNSRLLAAIQAEVVGTWGSPSSVDLNAPNWQLIKTFRCPKRTQEGARGTHVRTVYLYGREPWRVSINVATLCVLAEPHCSRESVPASI
ncbi:protein of unknown function (plasmid) [Pararobbsia alpina]